MPTARCNPRDSHFVRVFTIVSTPYGVLFYTEYPQYDIYEPDNNSR